MSFPNKLDLMYSIKVQAEVIGNLKAQLEAAQRECQEQARLNGMGAERETKLIAENARYKAALEFYADPYTWVSRSGKVGITPVWTVDQYQVQDDGAIRWAGGKRAREAIYGADEPGKLRHTIEPFIGKPEMTK